MTITHTTMLVIANNNTPYIECRACDWKVTAKDGETIAELADLGKTHEETS